MDEGTGISITAPTISELRPRVRLEKSKRLVSDEIKQEYIDRDLKHAKYVAFDSKTGAWRGLAPKEAADLLHLESSGISKRFDTVIIRETRPFREGQNVEFVFATKILQTPAMVFNAIEDHMRARNYAPIGNIPLEEVETGEFTEIGDGADDVANMQDVEDFIETPSADNKNDVNQNLHSKFE
jgi:hypothetical protein